ncbi:hypothetical protein SAMN02745216_02500 [Desulfatibacillum alkenivorans DSM 16219]|uniref:Uncharacterized protein n=1 Tax=Desulfatibacillum alkenivorans DSM 16219 TaxID=1121393 RepID=A0A1M6N3H4_9BACT|nr:hypothetical protein [Desulfatibacillum alkenivorans]SHJ90196.1 hypothetical protein SAMN02745216_02500 [Desulfatibacillum alkenivorans DSM 16219]
MSEKELSKMVADMKTLLEDSYKGSCKKEIVRMLELKFGLSPQKAKSFIHTILEMHDVGVRYDALPEPWYFQTKELRFVKGSPTQKVHGDLPRGHAKTIAEERDQIAETIRKFRRLSDQQKMISIDTWHEDFRLSVKNNDYGTPTEIANLIMANRWGVAEDTIKDYVKVHARAKRKLKKKLPSKTE